MVDKTRILPNDVSSNPDELVPSDNELMGEIDRELNAYSNLNCPDLNRTRATNEYTCYDVQDGAP